MVGGIALSSCGSNTSVETPSTPSQPGQGSGGASGDQNQGGNNQGSSGNTGGSTGGGSTQQPGGSGSGNQNQGSGGSGSSGSGGQNQGSSGSTGGDSTQQPPQIEVPTLPENANLFQKYILDPGSGARVILNKDENANDDPNNDNADSNVKKLLDFCNISTEIDPLGYNGYFGDALTFTGAKSETGIATVSVKEDEKLKDYIGFYLYQGDLSNSNKTEIEKQANWKDLTGTTQQDITITSGNEVAKNVHLAVYFKTIDDINKNSNGNNKKVFLNPISAPNFEFVQEFNSSVKEVASDETTTITPTLNKNLFIYKLVKSSNSKATFATDQTQISNKVELEIQKTTPMIKDEGWKSIDSLPIVYPNQPQIKLTTSQIAHAYVYSIDISQTDNDFFKLQDGVATHGSTGSLTGTKFRTHMPSKIDQSEVNLYLLYTNGINVDISQFNLKPGCKFILINNNPYSISTIKTSSLFNPEYGTGKLRGPIFELGSSFGWIGRFNFESNWKTFISTNINKPCYTPIAIPTTLSIEPNKNI